MLNGKAAIILLTVELIKKILLDKMSCFSIPYNRSKNKIKDELHLSKHATKSELKIATGVDTSEFAKRLI